MNRRVGEGYGVTGGQEMYPDNRWVFLVLHVNILVS